MNDDNDEHDQPIKQSLYYSDNDFIATLSNSNNPVAILSLNCQSISSKFDDILILVEKVYQRNQNIDILCIQESWLGEHSHYSQYNIDGYDMYYQSSVCSSHTLSNSNNPVAILSLNCQSISSKFDDILILVEKVYQRNQNIDILCIQESWLGEHSHYSQYNIDGYDMYYQSSVCSSHTGLII